MAEIGWGRVAVIGDLAGHRDELVNELVRLGADENTLRLPDDLSVVQVGDLVHRGPDSEGVVALVDRYLREQPAQWVQLAGNHEANYLRAPAFAWPERLDASAVDRMRSWWARGTMRAAAAVHTDSESFLVTHAGLTEGFWRLALDVPQSAAQAAAAINSFIGTHDDVLFSAGHMLGRNPRNLDAGPLWAACATELVPSWFDSATPLPFSQLHGHSMIADWQRRELRCPPEIAALVEVDDTARHETVTVPGGRIIGIDPGHARKARTPWRAYTFDRAVVVDDTVGSR